MTRQAPLSMEFQARTEEGVCIPPAGNVPRAGTEPMSAAAPALAGGLFTTKPLGKPEINVEITLFIKKGNSLGLH